MNVPTMAHCPDTQCALIINISATRDCLKGPSFLLLVAHWTCLFNTLHQKD
jgi:hypothetical protein